MGLEIERKFLVRSDFDAASQAVGHHRIEQGYLSSSPDATVRVRLKDDRGILTVKTRNTGAVRHEWEYEIPADDARSMLERSGVAVLSKVRYVVPYGGRDWEIDVFSGALAGLVVAEVELESEDARVELPPFVTREVTDDARYYNSNLLKHGLPSDS